MPNCLIEISQEGIVNVQLRKNQGDITKKTIAFSDFVDAINHSVVKNDNDYMMLGAMPKGFYNGGISKEDSFFGILTVLERKYPAKYHEERFLIPYPSLIFSFTVKKTRLVESAVYAATDASITDKTKLYHFPYANVYGNGTICWGENSLPQIGCLEELQLLPELFFGSPYNDDLFRNEWISKHDMHGMYSLMKSVSKMEHFPNEWLEPYSMTVGDMIKSAKFNSR